MAKFFYIAKDKEGNKVTGIEEGGSSEEIAVRLQSKGFIVINISLDLDSSTSSLKFKSKHKHSRISSGDLVNFCRQMATLVGSGVTILRSLDIILKQTQSKELSLTIQVAKKNMEEGLSFHEALAKHPKVFSELWVNLVESGEASGSLSVVLDRLAKSLERNAEFKRKIITALFYPAILMIVGFSALLFLTIKIIPTFAEVFKGFNVALPLMTRMLMAFSEMVRKYLVYGLIGLAVSVGLLKKYISTESGRRKYERLLFRLPVFGDFFRALIAERFSSAMSILIESGVPILYSLEIVEKSVGSFIVADYIRNMKEDVRQGKTLSQPLSDCDFFEPMVVQMVSVGEEIGELSQMFKRINVFYQESVETFLARFTAMFEPVMLIFMGGIIGLMVLGIFLPIFQISKLAGN
ncbi:MAG: type II secretion system F family protein [Candidatus Omnitrophota bacterium]